MPTDLERQLARFAEALDREASAISVDEIFSCATVAVDVDLVERSLSDRAARVNGVSWTDASPGHDGIVDRVVPMELAPAVAARRPARRRVALKVALGVAAAAVLVVALAAIVRFGDESDRVNVPSSTVPTPPPTQPPTSVPTTSAPTTTPPTVPAATSGGMWPQATVEEVRVAQERADAGDPAYTWQVDPQLVNDDSCSPGGFTDQPCQIELVDRFLREVLGWEAYMSAGDYGNGFFSWKYLRCAPGRTNPLYPPGPEPASGESCAPTLDDFNYESVSLDLRQLDRQGVDGIWVVNRWGLSEPFAQADPVVAEAQATQGLEKFLAARVAGQGAEGQMRVFSNGELTPMSMASQPDVPLLYATTSGAPYERYEIERVGAPQWPNGHVDFRVRLFADGGTTVVEQEIARWSDGGFYLEANSTTEDGQPITLTHTDRYDLVTVSTPSTWNILWPAGAAREVVPGVWFGLLSPPGPDSQNESIGLVDPVAYDSWCAANGGSPLLSAPADAAAIAQQVVADPNFETTAPVAARIGGLDAVSIDVALAPGGEACAVTATCCGEQMIEISRWIHSLEPGLRLRLYLVDLPKGMSVETLAITVVAPEQRFDEFIEETQPIIDSITFHPRAP